MRLEDLISYLPYAKILGSKELEFSGIADDSRQVKEGFLFVAIKGFTQDGHAHVSSAIERGAIAVLVEKELSDCNVTQIIVENTQAIISVISLAFYGNPQNQMSLVGVTGTNGKTTISTLVYQVLDHLGYQAGLIGTAGKRIGKQEYPSNLTTPGPIELAKDLALMRDSGCSHVVMEVSSHALKQHRVDGLTFSVGIFTNLTHDHLDYHGSVEDYASSKQHLFNQLNEDAVAIINMDDEHGQFMAVSTRASVWDVSFKANSGNEILKNDANGLQLLVDGALIDSSLSGKFNAYNVFQAYLACVALGVNPNASIEALAQVTGAVGRLDKVRVESDKALPTVFVDYAHTPDALKNVASTLASLKKSGQELVVVFGCGGNRDTSKRPVMAKIAEEFGDRVIATSDNPRFENPELILDDIVKGFSKNAVFERIVDRKQAIAYAIESSKENSLILIAGKGHETYQEIEGVKYPMDDRVLAKEALLKRLEEKELH